jgi:hypothetical protein
VEFGVRVGQQVTEHHQQRPTYRDQGLLLAAAAGDASVAFAQEGVGLAGGAGAVTQDPGQVGVSVSGAAPALLLPGGLLDAGGELSGPVRKSFGG